MTQTLVTLLTDEEPKIADYMANTNPMQADRWLLTSALQKAIRRGDTAYALNAGAALWDVDKKSFWRRLHVIALEDVGLGNPAAMMLTLAATAAPAWIRRMGEKRTALYLTRLLADGPKNRMADHLVSIAEKTGQYATERREFAKMPDNELAVLVQDEATELAHKALALWFLAGTNKYPSEYLEQRRGSLEAAIKALGTLSVPPDILATCHGVMSRTGWPLALFMPLIWQEWQKYDTALVHMPRTTAPEVMGVPVYAADKFTRCGQRAIRKLQKSVPFLRNFSVQQVGLGLFYAEGCLVSHAMQSSETLDIALQGEMADAEGVGMTVPEYLALQDALVPALPLLDEIRTKLLPEYVEKL